MRFQETKGDNPNTSNNQVGVANKAKMESDSTILGIPGAKIQPTTTTIDNTRNKYNDSQKMNSPLPGWIEKNIKTTHFEIGPGGRARPSEQKDSYSPMNSP